MVDSTTQWALCWVLVQSYHAFASTPSGESAQSAVIYKFFDSKVQVGNDCIKTNLRQVLFEHKYPQIETAALRTKSLSKPCRLFRWTLRGGHTLLDAEYSDDIQMISSDLTSDLSGFVSTIFLSDEDGSYNYAKQMLPVSDLNSSLAEKDLMEMDDPLLPPLIANFTVTNARTGREYLKLVREQAASLNIDSAPSIRHVVVSKSGTYIPYDLKEEPSESCNDDDVKPYPKQRHHSFHPSRNRKSDKVNISKFLDDRKECHSWHIFEQRLFWLREQLCDKRSQNNVQRTVPCSISRSSWQQQSCVFDTEGCIPLLKHLVTLTDHQISQHLTSEISRLAESNTKEIFDTLEQQAQRLFALLVAAPRSCISTLQVMSLQAACAACRHRLARPAEAQAFARVAQATATIDVVMAVVGALGSGRRMCGMPRRRPRDRPEEPDARALLAGRWGRAGQGVRLWEGGRVAEMGGEGTAVSEAGVAEGRWYAGVKVLRESQVRRAQRYPSQFAI